MTAGKGAAMQPDAIVIGAGTVGAAVGYGLADKGLRVLVLDGSDGDYRAARANFGLVWLHGKGPNMPAYHAWTRRSVDLWPAFAAALADLTGTDVHYEQRGGLAFCLGEAEFDKRRSHLAALHRQCGGEPDCAMLDRSDLIRLMPGVRLGDAVVGASFGHLDGHANPLRLLAALHAGIAARGGVVRSHAAAVRIVADGAALAVESADGTRHAAPRLVIAAGLGSAALAAQVGLTVPLRPERGQILVTERTAPLLPLPASGLRQTRDGTVMIGATNEDAGFDTTTTTAAAVRLARRALRIVPALAGLTLVRQWAALRIMTPDSYPIYAQSPSHPGAFVVLCHSGVTLAALHASAIADAVRDGALPPSLDPFHHRRFDVPKAA